MSPLETQRDAYDRAIHPQSVCDEGNVTTIIHRDAGMATSYSLTLTMNGKPCYGAGGFATETLAAHAAWKAACARGWTVTARKSGKRVTSW